MRELRKNLRVIWNDGLARDKKENVMDALKYRTDEDVNAYINAANKNGFLALASEYGELFLAASPADLAIFKGDMVSDRLGMGYLALN